MHPVTIDNRDMAKQAKRTAKEPVRIRVRQLANGNQSIYLDYYSDGVREREFLKMYLIPERTPLDKQQNKDTWNAAQAIRAQRVTDLNNGAAGIKRDRRGDLLLSEYLSNHLATLDKLATSTRKLTALMIAKVLEYGGEKVRLKDVDKDFCRGFVNYLLATDNAYTGKPLTKCTVDNYFTRFTFAMNEAVRGGYIDSNPVHALSATDKVKPESSTREYLTIDEVQRLIESDCRYSDLKRAFMFSCFCGLRLSDIRALTWGAIEDTGNGGARVAIVQQKTGETLYLDLSTEAVSWLPGRGGAGDPVFNLGCCSMISRNVSQWAAAAGITKHVRFHTARHTFATMMLTLGADLYTTSKLLGHTNIQTTRIYAKIIDSKKQEAVNLVNGIFKH